MSVKHLSFDNQDQEHYWLAKTIQDLVDSKIDPTQIAVIARSHKNLTSLLPFLDNESIDYVYERSQNLLENSLFKQIYKTLILVQNLDQKPQEYEYLIPEILGFEFWEISAIDIWKISHQAYMTKSSLVETCLKYESKEVVEIINLFLELSKFKQELRILDILDILYGQDLSTKVQESLKNQQIKSNPYLELKNKYPSKFYKYYFNSNQELQDYLPLMESLRSIIDNIKSTNNGHNLSLHDFLKHVQVYSDNNLTLPFKPSAKITGINLLTAHKAKGLEFEHVFVLDASDSGWFLKGRSNLIRLPKTLEIEAQKDSEEDILRLFYVACTRAKNYLYILYPKQTNSKPEILLRFLDETNFQAIPDQQINTFVIHTQNYLSFTSDQKALLDTYLENYKFSITHLTSFVDLEYGGPEVFLKNTLLKFPQPKADAASFGTAVHNTLKYYQQYFSRTQTRLNLSEIKKTYQDLIDKQNLNSFDYQNFLDKGYKVLTQYFESGRFAEFKPTDIAELSFGNMGIMIDQTPANGMIDRIIIQEDKTIEVVDYKTGKGFSNFLKHESKPWRYLQQLIFYKFLIENSSRFANFVVTKGSADFLESDYQYYQTIELTEEMVNNQQLLIKAVLQRIMNKDFPDVSKYSKDYKGTSNFVKDLLK